ncbi:MAG TPA: Uma2 family endonuclease [Polyangium sp.]|nr:Uma2 family endonuclease [Polyangium sp.]
MPHLALPNDLPLEGVPNSVPFGLPNPFPASFSDWLSLPEDYGAEFLNGQIDYKSFPSLDHGRVQRRLAHIVDPYDTRLRGDGSPGGWWIGSEVDVIINGQGVRPDMAGWRRDRFPKKPVKGPNGAIEARPDWVAEILSETNQSRDLKIKFQVYQAALIPHYWILDPIGRVLLVFHRQPKKYIYVDGGGVKRTLRAQPFDGLMVNVGSLFPDVEDDDHEIEAPNDMAEFPPTATT